MSGHQPASQEMGQPGKRPVGRPPKYADMLAPIPDTPENIARAVLNTPPKKEKDWKYLRGQQSDPWPGAAQRQARDGQRKTNKKVGF